MEELSEGKKKKKLLVLDVNGLLVDTYYYRGEKRPGKPYDAQVGNFYVYKRPFCDEFVNFCLEHFVVGIWSSSREHNLSNLVDFIFDSSKDQLAFSWHQFHCTDTGIKALDNNKKPLFLKELSKLWELSRPEVPWEEGNFGPSNTLLIDDTPYKALRNPPYTAIFPRPFTADDNDDNLLGGQLLAYLKNLSVATDVQDYVKANPIGQPSITLDHQDWVFYSQFILEKGGAVEEVIAGGGMMHDVTAEENIQLTTTADCLDELHAESSDGPTDILDQALVQFSDGEECSEWEPKRFQDDNDEYAEQAPKRSSYKSDNYALRRDYQNKDVRSYRGIRSDGTTRDLSKLGATITHGKYSSSNYRSGDGWSRYRRRDRSPSYTRERDPKYRYRYGNGSRSDYRSRRREEMYIRPWKEAREDVHINLRREGRDAPLEREDRYASLEREDRYAPLERGDRYAPLERGDRYASLEREDRYAPLEREHMHVPFRRQKNMHKKDVYVPTRRDVSLRREDMHREDLYVPLGIDDRRENLHRENMYVGVGREHMDRENMHVSMRREDMHIHFRREDIDVPFKGENNMHQRMLRELPDQSIASAYPNQYCNGPHPNFGSVSSYDGQTGTLQHAVQYSTPRGIYKDAGRNYSWKGQEEPYLDSRSTFDDPPREQIYNRDLRPWGSTGWYAG